MSYILRFVAVNGETFDLFSIEGAEEMLATFLGGAEDEDLGMMPAFSEHVVQSKKKSSSGGE
jgi:hypothetical protein